MRKSLAAAALAAFVFVLTPAPASFGPFFRAAAPENSCFAASPEKEIRVLGKVTVNRKQVYLADICSPAGLPVEWKELFAKNCIGEAPSAGSEKFIDSGQLKSYIESFLQASGLPVSEIKLEIPDRVVIGRESAQVSQEQIEAIFRKFVLESSPWKQEDITIQRVHYSGLPFIPAGEMTHEVVPQARERFLGNVSVTVHFYVDGEKVRSLAVTGKVEVFQDVYHASRPLKQNGVIEPADLEVQRTNISDAPDRFATLPDQVLGLRLLHNIGTHQAINLKDLDKPLLLKRGDPVTIVFDQPGIKVTAKGQASSDGALGDTVPVVNVSSKKTVYCRVLDTQTVRAAQ